MTAILGAAGLFALGADSLDDYGTPIAWFESRLSSVPAPRPVIQHVFSNVLGGLLLRAGRIDEAIARVNQGIAAAKEVEMESDWAYLALAHARRGDRAEARRWLDRLRGVQDGSRASFWETQGLEILQHEAESLLLDAEFPSDPFPCSSLR